MIALFGHVKVLRTLGMGSAALVAAVSYRVRRPEFPAKDDKVPTTRKKEKKKDLFLFFITINLIERFILCRILSRKTIHSKLFNRTKHAVIGANPLEQASE